MFLFQNNVCFLFFTFQKSNYYYAVLRKTSKQNYFDFLKKQKNNKMAAEVGPLILLQTKKDGGAGGDNELLPNRSSSLGMKGADHLRLKKAGLESPNWAHPP